MNLRHEVVGDGPLGEVLLLGEAPGEHEVAQGKPFVGISGQILRRYCASVGLDRVRFENVIEYKLKDNDVSALYHDGKKKNLPSAELLAWHIDLRSRIKIINPKVIIACGETALRAITDYRSIADTHSYVLDSLDIPCPIVAAYHPAFILRQPENAFWLKFALKKAKEVLDGAREASFTLDTSNNFEVIRKKMLEGLEEAAEICLDIETIKNRAELTAFGFCFGNKKAYSVSRVGDDALAPGEWETLVGLLGKFIAAPHIRKIGQNIMFDLMMLWQTNWFQPAGEIVDTMHMANLIYSDLKKSLKELARFYLYCPPWKGAWNTTGEKLRIYNATDVIHTYRIAQRQYEDLELLDLFKFYKQNTMAMFPLAFRLATKGIKVDEAARAAMSSEVSAALAPLRNAVKAWAIPFVPPAQKKKKKRDNIRDIEITGDLTAIPENERKKYYVAKSKDTKHGLIAGKTYQKAYREEISFSNQAFNPRSSAQVKAVLVNAGVRLPKVKQQHTHEWNESTNEKALKKIIERNSDASDVLTFVRNMLVIRHGEKLLSSYCKAILDSDSRWRCSYNVEGTETGRSSTKKTPWGTGGNNQNIPRGGFLGVQFKRAFIPDEGKVFFQADQEQAEARVVAALAGCQTMLDLFAVGQDIHEYAAGTLLAEDMPELKKRNLARYKLYRQYAKIVNHGGNYNMGPATLAENALKDGIDLSINQAKAFLKKRREIFPEVYAWHEAIRAQLHKDRTLWTPFGRRRIFFGKIDDNMHREALAHIPQSTVPHVTNLMWRWVAQRASLFRGPNGYQPEVLQMGHDSLLIQLDGDKEFGIEPFVIHFLAAAKTLQFDCGTVKDFNIPWDCATGTNWTELKKWTSSAST